MMVGAIKYVGAVSEGYIKERTCIKSEVRGPCSGLHPHSGQRRGPHEQWRRAERPVRGVRDAGGVA